MQQLVKILRTDIDVEKLSVNLFGYLCVGLSTTTLDQHDKFVDQTFCLGMYGKCSIAAHEQIFKSHLFLIFTEEIPDREIR